MHPVLVEIPTPWGPFPLWSYGVMLGTSLIVAWYLSMHLGEKHERLPKDAMANCFIATAVTALFFARVLYVVTNPDDFHSLSDFFALRSGGLVAYGGFLGGLLGSFGYWRYRKEKYLLAWADVVAPALASGLAFTRIGCYLFGCDFGRPLGDGAPAFLEKLGTFPHHPTEVGGSPAFIHHVQTYELSPLAEHSLPVHPTQLYESLFGFVLFGIAMLVWRHRKFRGQVILTVTLLYGIWRFFIEYVRDDPERGEYFGFSTSQWISLLLIPLAGFLFFTMWKAQAGKPIVPVGPELAPAGTKPEASEPAKAKKKKKKRKRA